MKPYSRAFSFTAHSKAPFVQISTRDFERRLIKEQLSDGNLTRHGNANVLTASLGCRGGDRYRGCVLYESGLGLCASIKSLSQGKWRDWSFCKVVSLSFYYPATAVEFGQADHVGIPH